MSDTSSESSGSDQLEAIDAAVEALSSVRRRRLLKALLEHDHQEAIVATVSDDAEPNTEAVQIEMYHNHLPKLDDTGFIEWDRERNRVRKGPAFDTIEKLLERLAEGGDGGPLLV
ncbi:MULTISPECIES: DUF7344 domain-containing protein [Natrialbaceae]|uniref:DUF7344 domain-containing protein n=1 Tax=Natrialbaceae TaxID=1644061 RepID=UPI00207D0819|nr:ArsR family transcriptional regulator [Natronococcus sp. CG52]